MRERKTRCCCMEESVDDERPAEMWTMIFISRSIITKIHSLFTEA